MSTRVLKYRLGDWGETTLPVTIRRVLAVGWQGHELVLWGEVVEKGGLPAPGVTTFVAIATGSEIPQQGARDFAYPEFVGTAQRDGDSPERYVLHVYRLWPLTPGGERGEGDAGQDPHHR